VLLPARPVLAIETVLQAEPQAPEAPLFCEGSDPGDIPEGATVGTVSIRVGNVFDPDIPGEDIYLYRLVNKLHIKTKPSVIRSKMLVAEGEPFDEQKVRESERILRDARYLYDAEVCVQEAGDEKVDLVVETRDVWTLKPGFHFGRSGGENTGGIRLEELNLLGRGIKVALGKSYTVDRDSTIFQYRDQNLFGSWVTGDATYIDSSDGHTVGLLVEQPFYALDSRRAASGSYLDDVFTGKLYDRGEIVNEFSADHSVQQASMGWSAGLVDGWARRWSVGLARDVTVFGPAQDSEISLLVPQDRRFQYPFLRAELVEDKFVTTRNRQQISRTEDVFLGWHLSGELGLLSEGLGSDRNGMIFNGGMHVGGTLSSALSWEARATLAGRAESGNGLADTVLDGEIRYFWRQSPKALFYVSGRGAIGHELDLDHQLLLGGDNGLRGYPLRYQSGERLALVTLEQRLFSDWYPFRLFHVGAAAFFDAGRTWGDSPLAAESLGLLKDVGVGLRLGNARSGTGKMIHIDLAMPLDGESDLDRVQIIVEARAGF
jgi:hypothetical protein